MKLLTIAALFIGSFASIAAAQTPLAIHGLTMRDTAGKLIERQPAKWTVFCFLGTECPLAKLYGPRLQRIADEFEDQGVVFIGVNSNVQDSADEIDAYAKTHAIRFAIAKDSDQSIADALGATRTPEVVLADGVGVVRYQGRIDDQYEPGIARPEPTQHDLRDAIAACLAGKPVAQPKTMGVGCLISRVKTMENRDRDPPAVTFTRDIAPLLNRHCVECHRDGEIGPFALTDYDEVVGWGPMMLEVIDQKRMPPWHADPEIGHFIGERLFPQSARDQIATWIETGMPMGENADAPEPPTFGRGWHLPTEPDVQFAMRDRPYRVPAEGVVEYQYFVVDPGWKKDRWIRAAQVIPGDASVVHHSIVFVRPPDGSDFAGIGWLGAYVPGQRMIELPASHGRRIPAGSKLIFQMHYTPTGQAVDDQTKVGVWFADSKPITHEVVTQIAINHKFEIPPHDHAYQVQMSVDDFPDDGRLLGVTPHMHLRGKSFTMSARTSSGTREPLLRVPAYDFNWQHWYAFAEPVELDEIDTLQMNVTFDNSSSNPVNPAPEEFVSWGDQTWEEMAIAFFDVAFPVGNWHSRSRNRRTPDFLPSDSELAQRQAKIEKQVETFMKRLDSDGDGEVTKDEAPVTMRRNGFWQLDHDGNGRITRDEIRTAAEWRQ